MPIVDRLDFRDRNEPDIRYRGRPSPQSVVAFPAKALIAAAFLNLVIIILEQGFRLYVWSDLGAWGSAPSTAEELVMEAVALAAGIFQLASAFIVIVGAWKMLRLESYGLAFAAAVLMLLPWVSPCCVVTLPFGIYALVTLNRPEVKEAFQS